MSSSYERPRGLYLSRTYGNQRRSQPRAIVVKETSLNLMDKQYKRLIERTEKVTYDLARLQTKSSQLTKGLVIVGCETPSPPVRSINKYDTALRPKQLSQENESNDFSGYFDTPKESSIDCSSPSTATRGSAPARSLNQDHDCSPIISRKDRLSPSRLSENYHLSPDKSSRSDSFKLDRTSSKDHVSPDKATTKDRLSSPDRISYKDRRNLDRSSYKDCLSPRRGYKDNHISRKPNPITRQRRLKEDSRYNEYGQITTEKEWRKLLDTHNLIERAVELMQDGMRYPKRFVYESDTPLPKPYCVPIGTKLISNPHMDGEEEKEAKTRRQTGYSTNAEATTDSVIRPRLLAIEPQRHITEEIRGRIRTRLNNIRSRNSDASNTGSKKNQSKTEYNVSNNESFETNKESSNDNNDQNNNDSNNSKNASLEMIDTSGYESRESHNASESEREIADKADLSNTDEDISNREAGTIERPDIRNNKILSEVEIGADTEEKATDFDRSTEDHDIECHLDELRVTSDTNFTMLGMTEEAEDEMVDLLLRQSRELLNEQASCIEAFYPTLHQTPSDDEEVTNGERFNGMITTIIEKSDGILETKEAEETPGHECSEKGEEAYKTSLGDVVEDLIQRSDETFEQQTQVIPFVGEREDMDRVHDDVNMFDQSLSLTESSILSGAQDILDDTETFLLQSGIATMENDSDDTWLDEVLTHSILADSTTDRSMEVKTSILGRLLAVLHRLLAFLTFQTCRQRNKLSR